METKWIQLSNNNSGLECITLFSFPLQLFHLIEYAFYNSLPQSDPSLTSACSRIPNNPFYASVVCVLYWYRLPLTSLLLASRPTHAFPNTSQSFPCIEQLLPQHGTPRPFFKNIYIYFLQPNRWLHLPKKASPQSTSILHRDTPLKNKGASSKWHQQTGLLQQIMLS